jgi:signal peptidase II
LAASRSGKVSVRAIILLVVIALAVLAVDQLAKWWVVGNLPYRVPRNIVGELLIFEYDRNPGAAFSIGTGSTWIFSIVAVAVLVFVVWYARRIRSMVWALVFGLVLGGLLGNLTDRLFRPPGFGVGEVVDFLRIPLLPAIFNLADSAIVCAMVLFLILTVMGVGLDGKRAAKAADHHDDPADAVGRQVDAPAESTRGGASDASADPAAPASAGSASTGSASGGPVSDREPSHSAGETRAGEPTADADGADHGGERAQARAARVAEAGHPVDGRA